MRYLQIRGVERTQSRCMNQKVLDTHETPTLHKKDGCQRCSNLLPSGRRAARAMSTTPTAADGAALLWLQETYVHNTSRFRRRWYNYHILWLFKTPQYLRCL